MKNLINKIFGNKKEDKLNDYCDAYNKMDNAILVIRNSLFFSDIQKEKAIKIIVGEFHLNHIG